MLWLLVALPCGVTTVTWPLGVQVAFMFTVIEVPLLFTLQPLGQPTLLPPISTSLTFTKFEPLTVKLTFPCTSHVSPKLLGLSPVIDGGAMYVNVSELEFPTPEGMITDTCTDSFPPFGELGAFTQIWLLLLVQ